MKSLEYLRKNIKSVINKYDIPGQPKGNKTFKFKKQDSWFDKFLLFLRIKSNVKKASAPAVASAPVAVPAPAPAAAPVNYNEEVIAVIMAAITVFETDSNGNFGVTAIRSVKTNGIPIFEKTVPDIYPLIIKYSNRINIEEPELYKKAWIQRAGFSKIRSMKKTGYKPQKSTVLCLCLALKLSLSETLDMLQILGYTLSNDIMVDKIVAWCLEQNQYELEAIDEIIKENDGEYRLIPYC